MICSGSRLLSEAPVTQKRVALAFFGLTRSLKYTIDSIRKNIFQQLKTADIAYDVYLHTYNLKRLSNSRSGEAAVDLNTTEWRLLEPDHFVTTDQVSPFTCFIRSSAPFLAEISVKSPRKLCIFII